MRSFGDYLKLKLENEEKSVNNGTENLEDKNHLSRIFDIAWKSHAQECRNFIEKLAKIDPEIQTEYEQVSKKSDFPEVPREQEKEVIVPSQADAGYNVDYENN